MAEPPLRFTGYSPLSHSARSLYPICPCQMLLTGITLLARTTSFQPKRAKRNTRGLHSMHRFYAVDASRVYFYPILF